MAGDGEFMVNQPKASAWHVAILVIASLGVYANAIPNGFVHDDHKLLEEESRITGPIDIRRIFQTNYWGERLNAGLYRPLTVLSFAVDHAAFGLELNGSAVSASGSECPKLKYAQVPGSSGKYLLLFIVASSPIKSPIKKPLPLTATLLPTLTNSFASYEYQQKRTALRERGAPEIEVEKLFREVKTITEQILNSEQYFGKTGAFEGAIYKAKGFYRPEVDCIMFTRNPDYFCKVCTAAILNVIDIYSK